MIIFHKVSDLQTYISGQKLNGQKIGFVPTMGALHDGHMQLIQNSSKRNEVTVCSIFVNPTQFNDKNDFEKYPITIEKDIVLLEQNHCDVLFLPSVNEMYPNGQQLTEKFELGTIENLLEGSFRAGHFQGVCQVVYRLLSIVQPDELLMGQKDYQQVKVIRKMIETKGIPVHSEMVPIVRAANGLALSSRNVRLSEKAKDHALALVQTLEWIKENYGKKSIAELEKEATQKILDHGFEKVDYCSIVLRDSLEAATDHSRALETVALVAAWIDDVRLIDNLEL